MKKNIKNLSVILPLFFALLIPQLVAAAPVPESSGGTGSLNVSVIQNIAGSIIAVLNTVVVPLIFAIAFIIFLWKVYTYFIAGGASEENRSEGSKFVLAAVIGFAVMISIWGLVNLVGGSLNLNYSRPDLPCFSGNCANGGTQTP